MINIRIPKEIRTYKEKIAVGLTVRQLLATIAAMMICVPLYFFGKKYLPEDVTAWAIIIVALPIVSIGFIRISGLPMEKFSVAVFRWFIAPSKRKFATDNYFRELDNAYEQEVRKQIGKRNLKKMDKSQKIQINIL